VADHKLAYTEPALSLLELFCHVDDLCRAFVPAWHQWQLASGAIRRNRRRSLSLSEIRTILIWFHCSGYRNFKTYYQEHVQQHLRSEFPTLVSYSRFVEFTLSTLLPWLAYRRTCLGPCTGISFLDATALAVCDPHRISQHQVFAGWAPRGKTSPGWFLGFKWPWLINDRGELLNVALSPGNTDDRRPVPVLVTRLLGTRFADKGYISQPLFRQLRETFGLQLITTLRANMQNRLLPLADTLLLRKQAISETVLDQLKNISQIVHTRTAA
jgi:hypothetical protein